jgi:hypothetical protein
MLKRVIAVSVVILAAAWFWPRHAAPEARVMAAGPARAAFLIRLGLDEKQGVDWSGSVTPAPARLAAWQFDEEDRAGAADWKCASREQGFWDTPYERKMGPTSNKDRTAPKGVLVEYDAAPAEVHVTTAQGAFSFAPDAALWSAPRRFLNGRAEVRAAPVAAALERKDEVPDYPALLAARDGTLWLAYIGWGPSGDQVFVRRRQAGAWSAPEPVAPAPGDFFRAAIAQDARGHVWVVWAAQANANFDLYARAFDGRKWSAVERLTSAPGSDIYHSMTSDAKGNLHLVWQSARAGNFDIYMRTCSGGKWGAEMQVSSDPANDWEPVVSAAPDGRVTVVWDTYSSGSYDVVSRTYVAGKAGPLVKLAATGAFEARASAAYDAQGRLWVAWDESDWNWGKDYGNLIEGGRGLLTRRQTRVAVWTGGKLLETAAPFVNAVPEEFRQVYQRSRLVVDGHGAPWVFYRYRVNLPRSGEARAYRGSWRMAVTRFENGRWMPALEFPVGYGRMDAPMAATAADGRIELAWVGDARLWPSGIPGQQVLHTASLPAASGAAPAAAELAAFRPPTDALPPSHPGEAADVARVRAYRATVRGRQYRIVRGDIHRHTDLSWDGNRDGTLDDAYRYALDAAGFDFLGVCDHQAGQSIPYHWWMLQKAADLFTIPGRFVPFYSYERSLKWPNGHRNVFFIKRGNPVLEVPPAEARGEQGAAGLYAYLRRFGGLTSSHTSATGAGTDFRDSASDVEPVVEIYQGYRNNFEEPTGPRAGSKGEVQRFAAGFVWSAWKKGIRMGVQSSSDHVSTHISYAGLYVERIDRASLFEALSARRTYAATDNIIVEARMGGRFMGEAFESAAAPPIEVRVSGSGPLAKVEIIKNNRIVYSAPGKGREMTFTYTDREPSAGESYYYARVQQQDGQLAWSSPLWVRR